MFFYLRGKFIKKNEWGGRQKKQNENKTQRTENNRDKAKLR